MKGKVLVIDDEENIRFTFTTFLEEEGYEVMAAEDYESAFDILSQSDVDVIVCDIIMGPKTGIDVLREVKEKGLRSPIIMITGAPNIDTAAESVRHGAFDYIPKPFNKDVLVRVVRQAFRHRDLDNEKESYRRNLEAIFKSVQDAIVTVNNDMTITEANNAIENFLPYKPKDVINKNMADIFSKPREKCTEVLQKTLQTRQQVKECRAEWPKKHTGTQSVIMTCSPLIDSDGTFIGAVLVMRDVSRITDLERVLKERHTFHRLVGKSEKMQEIFSLVETLGEIETTVLITGESGTGKELVAEAIHYNGSRALKPLVKVNCSALAENLLESELFGHVAGAFTGATKDKIGRFQMADGGTIFLDEIGDISPSVQLKLMRVLQEKEFERVGDPRPLKVDVRVIAATNADLAEKIKKGTFREDLYYRLNVIEIAMPPLCERIEDITLLVGHFCEVFNKKFHKNIVGVSDDVMSIFIDYTWPGNIRELEHMIERAFILCRGDSITCEHLPHQIKNHTQSKTLSMENSNSSDSEVVLDALRKKRWNRTKAAQLLGISRQTLYRKIKELNLDETTE